MSFLFRFPWTSTLCWLYRIYEHTRENFELGFNLTYLHKMCFIFSRKMQYSLLSRHPMHADAHISSMVIRKVHISSDTLSPCFSVTLARWLLFNGHNFFCTSNCLCFGVWIDVIYFWHIITPHKWAWIWFFMFFSANREKSLHHTLVKVLTANSTAPSTIMLWLYKQSTCNALCHNDLNSSPMKNRSYTHSCIVFILVVEF